MSRLLISCGSLTSGGAERVLSILSKPFADHFSSITYLMWTDAPVFYSIDERVELISLEKEAKSKNKITKCLWFRKYVKNTKPDLILSFLTPFNMLALSALIGIKQKIAVAERNDPYQIPGGKIMAIIRNLLYRKATGILVQTQYARTCFKGRLAEKTHVIYNPTMMEETIVGSALKSAKEDRIVSVGRLQMQKDQKTLIDAFWLFRKNHPSYILEIYGEGPCREELEKHIKEKGMEGYVFLPGATENVWSRIMSAKVFVLTSLMEGMSNAMIEAMCLGIPVISTKVAGATELIKDSENGFLVDCKDINTISERMAFIADNENIANDIGHNASKLYRILNHQSIVPEWIKYINSL